MYYNSGVMEVESISQHTSRRFNKDLAGIHNLVLNMGGLVEDQFDRAIAAIAQADSELGLGVVESDRQVNEMEIRIDEECRRVLATRAPAAGDLRLIVAAMKTITDLERIGDETEKLGLLASRLATVKRPSTNFRELRNLAQTVKGMIRDALDAYARLDVQQGLEVMKADKVVDEEYEAIARQSLTFMLEDPRTITREMDLSWAARALERIGDHTKNICENAIYMARGTDVRHSSLRSVESEVGQSDGMEEVSR